MPSVRNGVRVLPTGEYTASTPTIQSAEMAPDLRECPVGGASEGTGHSDETLPPGAPLTRAIARSRAVAREAALIPTQRVPDEWTAGALQNLLTSNGYGRRVAKRGPLFVAAEPLPQSGRPGEPRHPQTPCLLWTGEKTASGYGRIGRAAVHRLTITLAGSPIPTRLSVTHRCERPLCARPDHLRPKKHQANVREGRLRRYPTRLLRMAPAVACKTCGGPTVPSIAANKAKERRGYAVWAFQCRPCKAAYKKLRQRPDYVAKSAPTGKHALAMDADALAAYRAFLRSEAKRRRRST